MYQDSHSAHIVLVTRKGRLPMPEKNRFSKPVAFNHKNQKDQEILNHVKRRNFSGYVKKLILADIQRGKGNLSVEPEPIQDFKNDVPKTMAEKLEDLKKKASNKPAN